MTFVSAEITSEGSINTEFPGRGCSWDWGVGGRGQRDLHDLRIPIGQFLLPQWGQ